MRIIALLQDEAEESEDEDAPLQNARELAGMRVNHGTGELGEGETMILTLADRSLLDAQGDLDEGVEELENALVVSFCLSACLARLPLQLDSTDGHQKPLSH